MPSAFRSWVFRSSVRLAVLIVATASAAQTFDVNGQTSSPSTSPAPSKKGDSQQTTSDQTGMGWGASIEVAREARAAQTALQHGDVARRNGARPARGQCRSAESRPLVYAGLRSATERTVFALCRCLSPRPRSEAIFGGGAFRSGANLRPDGAHRGSAANTGRGLGRES